MVGSSSVSPAWLRNLPQHITVLVQELQPQLEGQLRAVQALGAAVKAAMGEHASSADMQALHTANEALFAARCDLQR